MWAVENRKKQGKLNGGAEREREVGRIEENSRGDAWLPLLAGDCGRARLWMAPWPGLSREDPQVLSLRADGKGRPPGRGVPQRGQGRPGRRDRGEGVSGRCSSEVVTGSWRHVLWMDLRAALLAIPRVSTRDLQAVARPLAKHLFLKLSVCCPFCRQRLAVSHLCVCSLLFLYVLSLLSLTFSPDNECNRSSAAFISSG